MADFKAKMLKGMATMNDKDKATVNGMSAADWTKSYQAYQEGERGSK
jgi:hypothetical protein